MKLFTPTFLVAFAFALPLCRGAVRPEELTANLDEKIVNLTNLVLRERISRYTQHGTKICKLDTFDTLVNVTDGAEQYSEVRNKNKVYSNVNQIQGLWSFGETITLLRTTKDALQGAIPASDEVAYHYSATDRRWFVMIGPKTYWLEFEGSVTMSSGNAEIQKIAWNSAPLPPETGISRITWTVEFRSVEIAGKRCAVPKRAVYRIERIGNRAEWNVTEFAPQGMYGSESILSFEQ